MLIYEWSMETHVSVKSMRLRIIEIPTRQSFYTSLFFKLQNVDPYKSNIIKHTQ